MATFDISPLFRSSTLGFDRAWNPRHTVMNLDSSGYPAYDILRTGEETWRISLAVPGYTQNQITIETREGAVWVKGERVMDSNHNEYLHRGIDGQGFQRTFQLPDHVKVQGARLKDGILHVDLYRELPEALRPRTIEVQSGSENDAVLEDATRAA